MSKALALPLRAGNLLGACNLKGRCLILVDLLFRVRNGEAVSVADFVKTDC